MKKKFPDYTDPKTGIVYKQISDAPFRDRYGRWNICSCCALQGKLDCAIQNDCLVNKTIYKRKPIKKAKSVKTFPDFTDPKTGIVYAQVPEHTDADSSCCDGCYVRATPEGECPDTTQCAKNHTIFVPKEQNPLVAGINALKAENEKLKAENQRIKDENKLLNARTHAERIAAVSAVENLHSSCSKMQEELGVLQETNKKLKANKDAAAEAAESLHSSCNKLQREVNDLRGENKMLKDLAQTESVRNNRLNLERKELESRIAAQVTEITSIRNCCAKLKGALITARQEKKDLESSHEADQIAIKNLISNADLLNSALKELDALRAANKLATEAFQHAMARELASQGSYETAIKEQKDYAHKLECHLIEAAKENAELIKELDSYRCKKRGWFSKAPKDTDPDVLETMMRLQQEIVNLRDALGVPR